MESLLRGRGTALPVQDAADDSALNGLGLHLSVDHEPILRVLGVQVFRLRKGVQRRRSVRHTR